MRRVLSFCIAAALALGLASCAGVSVTVGAPAGPEPDRGVGLSNLKVVQDTVKPDDAAGPEDRTPPEDGTEPAEQVPPEDAVPPEDGTEPEDAVPPEDGTQPGPDTPQVDDPVPDTPQVSDPEPDTPPVTEPEPDTPPVTEPEPDTPPVTEPEPETPPVTDPEPDTPPVTEPEPETPPVTEPEPDNQGGLSAEEKKNIAMGYLDRPLADLIAEIGKPNSSDYTSSCLAPDAEDGNLYYDGFTVYTTRYNDGTESVYYVE